ncbi:MAG: hypothetical protein ACYYK0_05185 [Candidatus Eutrophobiaceae bacterium]
MNSNPPKRAIPLAHQQPRPCTALTLGNTLITHIDNNLLADLSEEQSIAGDPWVSTHLATKQSVSSDDWMTNIHSEILKFPFKILTPCKMLRRYVERGSVILRQGDVNDQFYIIKDSARSHASSKRAK